MVHAQVASPKFFQSVQKFFEAAHHSTNEQLLSVIRQQLVIKHSASLHQ
jgi:hypothetical protein